MAATPLPSGFLGLSEQWAGGGTGKERETGPSSASQTLVSCLSRLGPKGATVSHLI